jgi:hypothetical protein
MRQTAAIALFLLLLAPTAAHAQAYVAASISADVVRNSTYDDARSPGTGEALSFSLRTGAPVTSRFGVELDFTRAADIETDEEPPINILAEPVLAVIPVDTLPSIIGYRFHTKQQATTITAAAWARQEVSPRFSLVYLGGIAFAKLDRTVTTSFDVPPYLTSIYRPTYESRSVDYVTGPMAGIEARVALSEHAQLVPGLRLLAVGGGWIMRPAVGLGWTF